MNERARADHLSRSIFVISASSQSRAPRPRLAAGVDPKRIYQDSISGADGSRPGLDACLAVLAPGNMLVIWKLDRLGCSPRHLANTVDELTARGIGLKVRTGEGATIDTATASGRLMSETSPPLLSSNAS